MNVEPAAQTPQEFTATLSETEDYVYEVPDNVRITKITIPRIKSSDITNLVASNIKNNVTILGVKGTYTCFSPTEVQPLALKKSEIIASSGNLIYDATGRGLAGYNPVVIRDDGGGT